MAGDFAQISGNKSLHNLRKMQCQVSISQITQLAENTGPGSWFPKCSTCSNCKTRLLLLRLRKLWKLQDHVSILQDHIVISQIAEIARPGCYFPDCATCGNASPNPQNTV